MRIFLSIFGGLLVLFGAVWILQGLNIYFRAGFMVGHVQWAIYGALAAVLGIIIILLGARRPAEP